MSIEEDYKKPLKELYDSFPERTQEWINREVLKIRMYFIFWCIFLMLSALCIGYLVELNPFNKPIETWFQRAGSLIALVASLAEAIFVVKLKKLVRVSHWAQLACEIYVERAYKPFLNFSLFLTAFFVALGTIIWGYGDLLYGQFSIICESYWQF